MPCSPIREGRAYFFIEGKLMSNSVKVAVNKSTRTVTLLAGGSATPAGSVDAGTFTTRKNKVAMNFIRDLLYKLGIQNLQVFRVNNSGANLAA
jgi:hypothetical protein